MSQTAYLSKFTLKDYIAGLVKKDNNPPPPSTRDYIKAIKSEGSKQPRPSVSSLSPEAKPFLPMQPSYILVSSSSTPPISFSIPVYSSSLPLSTLRQYFPLATSMHYFNNSQMITLATVKNYDMISEGIEFGQEEFCIPDFSHRYFVEDIKEAVELRLCEASDEDVLTRVESLQVSLSTMLTEVGRLESDVSELHKLLTAQIARSLVINEKVSSNSDNGNEYDSKHNYYEVDNINGRDMVSRTMDQAEMLGSVNKESALVDGFGDTVDKHLPLIQVCDSDNLVLNNRKYVDDYGFSDSDNDDDGYRAIVDLKEEKVDINDIVKECNNLPSPVESVSASSRESESCSLSSRPRCVRRVVRNKVER